MQNRKCYTFLIIVKGAVIMIESKHTNFKTLDMAYIALFAVLAAVCSWISIPTMVPFTLQTFAVFCAVGILGGKRGTMSVSVYILLGAVGIPVFAGFTGGIGILFGATGGYIFGFVFLALTYWLITRLFGNKTVIIIIAMLSGLLVLYFFGTAWFMIAYARNSGSIGFVTALGLCVFPFIIPDLVKIGLAIVLIKRLRSHVKI
jgi:biotin transport system substrate-specific component